MQSAAKRNKSSLIGFQVHTSYSGPQLALSRVPVNLKNREWLS